MIQRATPPRDALNSLPLAPLVSVIVPSYNHERYVAQAIRSVLAQDVSVEYEVIAIDDGSSDHSRTILEDCLRDHPRARLIVQENRGISATFNRGLELARGEWVAYCCSDDRWHPQHLKVALARLAEQREAIACFGPARLIDADGAERRDSRLFEDPAVPDLFRRLLRDGNSLCFVAAVFRRGEALAVGGFDEALGMLQDYDLWLKLLQRGCCVATSEVTVDFRWHGENASGERASIQKRRDHIRILERALQSFPVLASEPALRARVVARLISAHRRLARRTPDWTEKLHHLRQAHRLGTPVWRLGLELLQGPPGWPRREKRRGKDRL
jgi:glycosyltransferase involved in cell wall biosynthesis